MGSRGLLLMAVLVCLSSPTRAENSQVIDDDGEAIDLDLFLNAEYMPLSFIMMDGSQEGNNLSMNAAMARQMDDGLLPVESTGDFDKALSTMNFHRKMINKYMCNSFVANEIMSEIVPAQVKMQRRMLSTGGAKPRRRHIPAEKMKFDEGSTGYKDWLSKTTSLEDVFRHVTGGKLPVAMNQSSKADVPQGFQIRRDSYAGDYADDYEEGTITGYAQFKPAANHQPAIPFSPHALPSIPDIDPTAGSKIGYPTAPQLHDHYIGSHHVSYEPTSYDKGTKALGLRDLFDIALTTLAFLSFGLFILQVLMCITLTKQQSAGMIMMPGTTGGGGNGDQGGEEIDMQGRRLKRAIEQQEEEAEASQRFLIDLNEISRRASIVIDALVYFNEDGGRCMQRVVCENNKFARGRRDYQKFYLPFFGLGVSWMAYKLSPNPTPSTGLELVKASVIGIGGGDCEKFYTACDMPKEWYHAPMPKDWVPAPTGKCKDDDDNEDFNIFKEGSSDAELGSGDADFDVSEFAKDFFAKLMEDEPMEPVESTDPKIAQTLVPRLLTE